MPSRFVEFLLEASRHPVPGREGLRAAMDRYELSEVERNLVLSTAAPARTDDIVKAYRKADDIVKAYRKVEDTTLRAQPHA